MRQLARTLLILGSVGACERAHPVVDSQERPAVGNIGQAGRPQQPAIAQPLETTSGVPAVGNIGQTGTPAPVAPKPARRVQRAQRAAATRIALQPTLVPERTVERPLVSREARPMTGNVVRKGAGPKPDRLAFQATDAATRAAIESPLVNRRERPATANMGRRSSMTPSEEYLAQLKSRIEQHRVRVRDAATDEERRVAQYELDKLVIAYKQLVHETLQGNAE